MKRVPFLLLAFAVVLACSDTATSPEFQDIQASLAVETLPLFPSATLKVDAGSWHNCALKDDGSIVCWGLNNFGQTNAPAGTDFMQVSAGNQHTCALKDDGSIVCWGWNMFGQTNSPAGTNFMQVSAGSRFTCALKDDGSIVCWGSNDYGATNAPEDTGFMQVSASTPHTCALKYDGSIVCWGSNDYGETEAPEDTDFMQVSAGYWHNSALKDDGSIVCWGWNHLGQADAPTGNDFTQVSAAGVHHACALKYDGSIVCWGWNKYGQTNAPAGTDFMQVIAGAWHTCALKDDGSIVCWGHNEHGQATPPIFNSAPEVTSDTDPVVVFEGQLANNTGTVSDADGDAVTLSASVGTVSQGEGTWSWSFGTTDGPAESQTVTIYADDGNGGEAQTSFTLTVTNVAPTVTSVTVPGAPVAIGDQPVLVSGMFTDPAGAADEAYTCTVDYGDGSGPQGGTVSGATCLGPEHAFAEVGIYTVTVAVTDKDGGTGSFTTESFTVIYDPDGGFVTGGGWFNSPEGAFKADELLTGKANFGFVSKYKKGANVPTGKTAFQFKAGDLNFHSSSYEWLVVNQNDQNAQFKGEGTINGTGVYMFMLWAGDNTPDGPDTFQIRITEVGGGIVYDNGNDQAIDGGSIVIHTK